MTSDPYYQNPLGIAVTIENGTFTITTSEALEKGTFDPIWDGAIIRNVRRASNLASSTVLPIVITSADVACGIIDKLTNNGVTMGHEQLPESGHPCYSIPEGIAEAMKAEVNRELGATVAD